MNTPKAPITKGGMIFEDNDYPWFKTCNCRIFLGEPPDPPDLGEGALTARVGQVIKLFSIRFEFGTWRPLFSIRFEFWHLAPFFVHFKHFFYFHRQ